MAGKALQLPGDGQAAPPDGTNLELATVIGQLKVEGSRPVDIESGGKAGTVSEEGSNASAAGSALEAAAGDAVVAPVTPPMRQGYVAIFRQFMWIGWLAFGGPAAHIGLFQKVFVDKHKWLTSTVFLELLALCQFMPGPTSTQVAYAIGITQQGVLGGLASGLLFQYPGLIIASLAGAGAAKWLKDPAPWLQGLTSGGLAPVGVALVASAAKSLTKSTCKDKVNMTINAGAAVITYYYYPTWIFPVVIAVGGLITLFTRRKEVTKVEAQDVVEKLGVGRWIGASLVVVWVVVLVVSIVVKQHTSYDSNKVFHWWEVFYRTGSLIFGGGQVVVPMLESAVVGPGWMSSADYFTGLALIQAMPGPLFNISAYMGAVIAYNAHIFQLVGIIVCFLGINAPGLLLIYGLLPWWASFRRFNIYRRALPGLNAAAVGLIVAACFQLGLKIRDQSPFPNATVAIGIIGFSLVDFLNIPAPIAVLVGGVLGIIGWAAGMN